MLFGSICAFGFLGILQFIKYFALVLQVVLYTSPEQYPGHNPCITKLLHQNLRGGVLFTSGFPSSRFNITSRHFFTSLSAGTFRFISVLLLLFFLVQLIMCLLTSRRLECAHPLLVYSNDFVIYKILI